MDNEGGHRRVMARTLLDLYQIVIPLTRRSNRIVLDYRVSYSPRPLLYYSTQLTHSAAASPQLGHGHVLLIRLRGE